MHGKGTRSKAGLVAGGVMTAALVAWGVAACGDDDHERCVDTRTDTVIPDAGCQDTSTATSYAHWYRGGSGFRLGEHVAGGEVGSHGVSRGGFGAHGEGHGGEGGHGG